MAQFFELTWLIVGIGLFFGMVAFVYRPSAAKRYDEYRKIPLGNE